MKNTIYSYISTAFVVFTLAFVLNFSWASDVLTVFWYGGGGGGWASTRRDACPNGDFSYSYYDNTCWVSPKEKELALKVEWPVKNEAEKVWSLILSNLKENAKYRWVKLTGKSWTITLRPSFTSASSLYIPPTTSVAWNKEWDGKITPPTVIENAKTKKLGVVFIKVWHLASELFLSKEVELVTNTAFKNGAKLQVYSSVDGKKWKKHSTAISDNGKVTIKTKTLSYFVIREAIDTLALK